MRIGDVAKGKMVGAGPHLTSRGTFQAYIRRSNGDKRENLGTFGIAEEAALAVARAHASKNDADSAGGTGATRTKRAAP